MNISKSKERWLETAVIKFLKDRPNRKSATIEIARWIFKEYPNECSQKSSLKKFIGDDNAIKQQLRGEIGRSHGYIQKQEPRIKTIEGSTRYFYYDSQEEEIKKISEQDNEHSLYEPLREFLYSELDIYSLRIDDKTSSNSHGEKGNIWLHPDIVGLEAPKWETAVESCSAEYTNDKPNLWSFEVKKEIDNSNIRESFFQAIANSSWANFGYLVVGDIISSNKMNVMKELRMLSTLHGIGCISLDKSAPRESHIIVPASRRSHVDWHAVNRIASENTDFLKYVKLIEKRSKGAKLKKTEWSYNEAWNDGY